MAPIQVISLTADLMTQPELRLILTNQQWGLIGMSVTSWYPTGALISDNQGCCVPLANLIQNKTAQWDMMKMSIIVHRGNVADYFSVCILFIGLDGHTFLNILILLE